MMSHRPAIIIFVIACFISAPAYAYLDPGSGSIILQGLLAAIAGALAAIKLYWNKLKGFFQSLAGKKKNSEKKNDHEN